MRMVTTPTGLTKLNHFKPPRTFKTRLIANEQALYYLFTPVGHVNNSYCAHLRPGECAFIHRVT